MKMSLIQKIIVRYLAIIFFLVSQQLSESARINGIFVRKNAKYMTQYEWQELREGFATMRHISRANRLDARGLHYQSNVHGWPRYDGSETANRMARRYGWHGCQHGHYWFLVWHRMYLYFFERILRKVTRNDRLTLPYWDYWDEEQRAIPLPFRLPNNTEENPLFRAERCVSVNFGQHLSADLVNPFNALKSTFFTTNKRKNELNVCHSLGGGGVDRPVFESDREGLLEMIPHDNIHLLVGGPSGHMSDNCRSARDPLFFVHHSMIDRIWESWTQQNYIGGTSGAESGYGNQTFDFFDERGERVRVRVQDFLDISKLNYRYDSLITVEEREQRVHEKGEEAEGESRAGEPRLFVSANASNLEPITGDQWTLRVDIKPQFQSRLSQMAFADTDQWPDGRRMRSSLQLSVEDMRADLIFLVYLNLPEELRPDLRRTSRAQEDTLREYFAGALAYVDSKCVPKTGKRNGNSLQISHCFDVTSSLKHGIRETLLNSGESVVHSLHLTFVPKTCDTIYDSARDSSAERRTPTLVRLNRALLIHFFY